MPTIERVIDQTRVSVIFYRGVRTLSGPVMTGPGPALEEVT